MRVLHICTFSHGGAGIAAINLHLALLAAGVDSHILFFTQAVADIPNAHCLFKIPLPVAYPVVPIPLKSKIRYLLAGNGSGNSETIPAKNILNRWHRINQIEKSRIWFNKALADKVLDQEYVSINPDLLSGAGIIDHINPDVINLHWVAEIGNLESVARLGKKYKVAWTLHDMRAFTGSCHYAGSCVDFKQNCSNCPAVQSNQIRDYIRISFARDKNIDLSSKLNIVGLNHWMVQICSTSSLLGDVKSTVIPNSVKTSVFNYTNRSLARQQLGLPLSLPIVLFVSDSVNNPRKGFRYIEELLRNPELKNVLFVAVGTNPNIESENISSTGRIDHKTLAVYYAAADLLLLPSVEDNLPNTMLEALCCGCPVVGFNIGGLPDCISPQNGYLSDEISAEGLQAGIGEVLQANFDRAKISENAIKLFAPQVQANNYIALYNKLLKHG